MLDIILFIALIFKMIILILFIVCPRCCVMNCCYCKTSCCCGMIRCMNCVKSCCWTGNCNCFWTKNYCMKVWKNLNYCKLSSVWRYCSGCMKNLVCCKRSCSVGDRMRKNSVWTMSWCSGYCLTKVLKWMKVCWLECWKVYR